jgi:hypothetical protein
MLLLNRGDRTHPEDGVQAPGRPGEKKCPMELRAEQVVRTYFSLDNSRPIGLSAFFLVIIMMPPKDRARQFCFMAEMMSISTGLLLFFVQTMATFEEGMSTLGMVAALMATAAVLLYVCESIMLIMFALEAAAMSGSIKDVVGLSEGIMIPIMIFVYAAHLTMVAFALSSVDSVGGAIGVGIGAATGACFALIYWFVGRHLTVHEALPTYHQTFWTQMDFVNGIAWFATGRRRLSERASHELDALMRALPEDVRRVVEGKDGGE